MKKWLSILTIGVLTSTILPNYHNILNVKFNNNQNQESNFIKMTGITRYLTNDIQFDKFGNVYTSSKDYENNILKINFYKCFNGNTNFEKININSLDTSSISTEPLFDDVGNIYIGTINGTVYKINNANSFEPITGANGNISKLKIDNNLNIYAYNSDGAVYKCLAGEANFKLVSKISDIILNLLTDKYGNIYITSLDIKSKLISCYKCLANQNIFIKMTGTNNDGYNLYIDKYTANIILISAYGVVYKCLAGQTNFTIVSGIDNKYYWQGSLSFDDVGNIYIGMSKGRIYKCLANETNFSEFTNFNSEKNLLYSVTDIQFDKFGNIYVIIRNNKIYKCLAGQTNFTPISINHEKNEFIFSLATNEKSDYFYTKSQYNIFRSN